MSVHRGMTRIRTQSHQTTLPAQSRLTLSTTNQLRLVLPAVPNSSSKMPSRRAACSYANCGCPNKEEYVGSGTCSIRMPATTSTVQRFAIKTNMFLKTLAGSAAGDLSGTRMRATAFIVRNAPSASPLLDQISIKVSSNISPMVPDICAYNNGRGGFCQSRRQNLSTTGQDGQHALGQYCRSHGCHRCGARSNSSRCANCQQH